MSTMKGTTISVLRPAEETQELGKLVPGNVFRFTGTVFEDLIAGDEPGGQFYYVTSYKKDGLVGVISMDWKVERRLPEESPVIHHHVHIKVKPNQPV